MNAAGRGASDWQVVVEVPKASVEDDLACAYAVHRWTAVVARIVSLGGLMEYAARAMTRSRAASLAFAILRLGKARESLVIAAIGSSLVALAGCSSARHGGENDAGIPGDGPSASRDAAAMGPDANARDGGTAPIDGGMAAGPEGGADARTPSDAGATCPITEVFSPPCNALVPSGPLVSPTCSSGEPPQAEGGTIAQGLYILESSVWYGAGCQEPPASSARSTWLLCGTLGQNADEAAGSDAGVVYTNYTLGGNGAMLFLDPICSDQSGLAGEAKGFTASGGRLTTMSSYNGFVIVSTYTLQ